MSIKPGITYYYDAYFHNDTGTLEDPTSPSANLRKPDGTFIALTTPAKVNSETGRFGGSIDTTGFVDGKYKVGLKGTVTTTKTVATSFEFEIEAINNADLNTKIGNPVGASVIADITTKASQTSIDNIRTDYTTARAVKIDNLDATVSSRSTITVANIWDALLSGISTVGSVGKLIKDYLDITISSRMATFIYTAPDNTTITNIKTALDTNLDAKVSLIATQTSVNLIPTNPLLTNDIRLNHIDANISATPTTLQIASQVDTTLISSHGSGAWTSSASGTGSIVYTYTVVKSSDLLPIDTVNVWATTDIGGTNIVALDKTNTFGIVKFNLNTGIYYFWHQKAGYTFVNPNTVIVSDILTNSQYSGTPIAISQTPVGKPILVFTSPGNSFAKTIAETYPIGYNFMSDLKNGDTLANISVTAYDEGLVDVTSTIIGTVGIDGTFGVCVVKGGTNNKKYRIVITVTTVNGLVISNDVYMTTTTFEV